MEEVPNEEAVERAAKNMESGDFGQYGHAIAAMLRALRAELTATQTRLEVAEYDVLHADEL